MTEKFIDVEIATPTEKRSIKQATACSAPGVLGSFQVLANHAAMVSELEAGVMKIQLSDQNRHFAISGGFLEVLDNKVLLLLESAEEVSEIDVDRAEKAMERAKQRLENPDATIDIARAEAALARAVNRLKVANKASTS